MTFGADDPVDEALRTMIEHGVRRLPVIEGDRLVGIVSRADVARETTPEQAGELVAALSRASDNNQSHPAAAVAQTVATGISPLARLVMCRDRHPPISCGYGPT